ncbi:MAG: hypothetical protein M1833_007141 [Piccolia ochrophora]|nr:MAG: hypothetical protein M1833_007141 [Piccolia ochrophora]
MLRPPITVRCATETISSEGDTFPSTSTALGVLKKSANVADKDTFENVRTKYFEALYASKTSLAYFAKGPLSKARATLQANTPGESNTEFCNFLEDAVMSLTLLDKKYKESVVKVVQESIFTLQSGGEAKLDTWKRRRRKQKAKHGGVKVGKNGLYPQEEEHILRWWTAGDDDGDTWASDGCFDLTLRKRIAELRERETKLQIILILEILALRAAASQGSTQAGGTVSSRSDQADAEKAKLNPKKSKRPQTMHLNLELLVDRLCIWQTLDTESFSLSDNRAASPRDAGSPHGNSSGNDQLRDFGMEVIAPLYSARLPDICSGLNRKLCGRLVPSPSKHGLCGPTNLSRLTKGSATTTKRQVLAKPKRDLDRVLTDDRIAQKAPSSRRVPPSLSRSLTEPFPPRLKRENSETPLSSIPIGRGSLGNSQRLRQREIDLDSFTKATEVNKKRKRNEEEQLLKDAISATKKPNRRLAVKELVEAAELRQVMATPRAHKKKSSAMAKRQVQPGLVVPGSATRQDLRSSPAPMGKDLLETPMKVDADCSIYDSLGWNEADELG